MSFGCCDGAAGEYREAIFFLNDLKPTLEPLRTFTAWNAYPSYGKQIRDQVDFIKGPVDEFLRAVLKYEPSLGTKAKDGHHRHVLRKLQWHVSMSKKVTALRSKIESHMRILDSLMKRLTLDVVVTTQENLPEKASHDFPTDHLPGAALRTSNTNTLTGIGRKYGPSFTPTWLYPQRRVEALLSVQHALPIKYAAKVSSYLDRGDSEASKHGATSGRISLISGTTESLPGVYYLVLLYLGYFLRNLFLTLSQLVQPSRRLLPMWDPKFNISFLDAVGSPPRILPYEHFKYFKVLQTFIQEEFKGVPLIERGRYLILSTVNNRFLDEKSWRRSVAPGSTVAMSALVRTQREDADDFPLGVKTERCPDSSCDGRWARPASQKWTKCLICTKEVLSTESGPSDSFKDSGLTDFEEPNSLSPERSMRTKRTHATFPSEPERDSQRASSPDVENSDNGHSDLDDDISLFKRKVRQMGNVRIHALPSTCTTHYEKFDIMHVREMFPAASEGIIQKLGLANSRRRQLFKYTEAQWLGEASKFIKNSQQAAKDDMSIGYVRSHISEVDFLVNYHAMPRYPEY
ncbi:Uu.00g145270.m01.CDS01 [Anthostomella pinea]|uniref:Uu.00g145270.m01.CDS01 n=1 Tax=Anthostomella pinea TaxID=933095 RepID=A0AAI8VR39_9PEZI|nr:Uu.00g145270.m01.CDS01 [Anthostomella pinea]